jgi:hypothetical protein
MLYVYSWYMYYIATSSHVQQFTQQFFINFCYKPSFESKPGICQFFTHIVIHTFRPYSFRSFGQKPAGAKTITKITTSTRQQKQNKSEGECARGNRFVSFSSGDSYLATRARRDSGEYMPTLLRFITAMGWPLPIAEKTRLET